VRRRRERLQTIVCCGRAAYVHSRSSTVSIIDACMHPPPRSALLANTRPGKPLAVAWDNVTLRQGMQEALRQRGAGLPGTRLASR
jgi:hypothetical protein